LTQPTSAAQDATGHHAKLKNADGSWKYTNALVHETSPYLLQHAHNPVNWYAWGPEAFQIARNSGKLIFLSVGYSTCYWCHVMEREVFENPDLAAILNEHCISIKVDREERPDVDEIYMTALQLTSGRGGWPMSMFLTPPGATGENDRGLKPVWAGTYIPPEPRGGMPGFAQIVENLSNAWRTRRPDILKHADRITNAVEETLNQKSTPSRLDVNAIQTTANALLRAYDPTHGGFTAAPKFPQPANLLFLLRVYQEEPFDRLGSALSFTLERMACGGMYDQVGGGFHRYSTDAQWLVPHFEKMLYDNGQLIEAYLTAQAIRPDSKDAQFYERVVRQTCDYVLREMTDPSGAFWSAQDAEVDTLEGGNYVWTPKQVRHAVNSPAQGELAVRMYGLDQGTNFQDPHHQDLPPTNVLFLPTRLDELAHREKMSLSDLLAAREQINKQMLAVRNRRKQPGTDDKVLVAWNGMMIAALARAGGELDQPAYIQAAAKAATYIFKNMRQDDQSQYVAPGLKRTMRQGLAKIPAFLEDYAFFAHGLISLYRSTQEQQWLEWAKDLTTIATQCFSAQDTRGGGYYDTLANQSDLFVRTVSTYDGALPSGNSQMIHNLIDLYETTHQKSYFNQAIKDLESFAKPLAKRGVAMVHMQHALLRAKQLHPTYFSKPEIQAAATQDQPIWATLDNTHVDLTSGSAKIRVTVKIKSGFHINAADPNQPLLVPTALRLDGAEDLEVLVSYPPAVSKQYPFATEKINVYENTLLLEATVQKTDRNTPNKSQPQLVLRYQACTHTECLEPQEIAMPITIKRTP